MGENLTHSQMDTPTAEVSAGRFPGLSALPFGGPSLPGSGVLAHWTQPAIAPLSWCNMNFASSMFAAGSSNPVSTPSREWKNRFFGGLTIFALVSSASVCAAPHGPELAKASPPFREGRLLIKPKPGFPGSSLQQLHRVHSNRVLRTFPGIGNLQVIQLAPGISVSQAADHYRRSGLIEYAEPDYVLHGLLSPNDNFYVAQWNLLNTGQEGGTVGADVRAPAAWNLQSLAENVLVAVVDSGIHLTHEDLAPSLWTNPGEIAGNGLDDDQNGYIDDVHGINTIDGSGNVMDDHGHGSHVAGIIGARGSNAVGIAGVAWRVKILSCKFLDAHLDGLLSDAIEGIDYARSKGAKIINGSFGMPSYNTQALYDALQSLRSAGILFVAACGNSGNNNDTTTPIYPASYDLDNIIAVAATTRFDDLAWFSSYGPTTVDLGAPGDTVLSCWIGANDQYNNYNGTSMAAPHVAGACALLWAHFPNEDYRQIKNHVLAGTDPIPALAGKCVTGGRLNLVKALQSVSLPSLKLYALGLANSQFRLRLQAAPGTNVVVQWSSNFANWVSFSTNQVPPGGSFELTNNVAPGVSKRFYRAFQKP